MDCSTFSFDLHVLSAPPALILSRDQTLVGNVRVCFAPVELKTDRKLTSRSTRFSKIWTESADPRGRTDICRPRKAFWRALAYPSVAGYEQVPCQISGNLKALEAYSLTPSAIRFRASLRTFSLAPISQTTKLSAGLQAVLLFLAFFVALVCTVPPQSGYRFRVPSHSHLRNKLKD